MELKLYLTKRDCLRSGHVTVAVMLERTFKKGGHLPHDDATFDRTA